MDNDMLSDTEFRNIASFYVQTFSPFCKMFILLDILCC